MLDDDRKEVEQKWEGHNRGRHWWATVNLMLDSRDYTRKRFLRFGNSADCEGRRSCDLRQSFSAVIATAQVFMVLYRTRW